VARDLRGLPAGVRSAIEVVSIDPYEPHRQAIRAELPDLGGMDLSHRVRIETLG
jgi:hypothetical protein